MTQRPSTQAQARVPAQQPLRKRHAQLTGLDAFIKACYPIIYVSTWEERRFMSGILERYGLDRTVFQWTYTKGLVNLRANAVVDNNTKGDPILALNAAERLDISGVFVFCDLHPWLDPAAGPEGRAVVRQLRDLYNTIRKDNNLTKTIIIVSPVLSIPPELEKELLVFDFPLPDREELFGLLAQHVNRFKQYNNAIVRLTADDRDKLLEAALGLTMDEADNAFNACMMNDSVLDATDVRTILAEKQLIIRKSGILEYYPAEEAMSDVGGLENLKEWLRKRARSFTQEARDFGLPQPKGVLLTGVQGCGKSLSAKAIANHWQLPLLRLDVGKVFGGLVGSSEENMRKAIKLAEAIAPCVLWVDELEKGFAGTQSSGNTDGGTTARVFGTFITWLQEKKSNVFVVATANQIENLPPELLRKGRFDEIFFIDLPHAAERKTIFQIHLGKRKRNPSFYDLTALSGATDGYSGAEIEQAIVSGLYEAFDEKSDLQMKHLQDAIKRTVPLSVTMREDIDYLREWARTRAVSASTTT